jgi:hypothetical protein
MFALDFGLMVMTNGALQLDGVNVVRECINVSVFCMIQCLL